MKPSQITKEELLTDISFLNFCLQNNKKDTEYWNNWINQYPEQRNYIYSTRDLFFKMRKDAIARKDIQPELKNFKELFKAHTAAPSAHIIPLKNILKYLSAAVIILVSVLIYIRKEPGSPPVPTTSNQLQTDIVSNVKRKIKLPDGSIVILNPNSSIELDKEFNQHQRLVKLKGQAFFDVAKNRRKPFIVQTGEIYTTAVGTSFLVRSYNKEKDVKISLISGKVKVEKISADTRKSSHRVFLNPKEQAVIVNKSSAPILKTNFDTRPVEQWKNDELSFSDAEFEDIVTRLQDWYGIEILVKNAPPSTTHFTGTFRHKSLKDILEAIGFSQHFKYSVNENVVTIRFDNLSAQ